jgi:hypothetical protein
MLANDLTSVVAIHEGHHDVENDEIWLDKIQFLGGIETVVRFYDFVLRAQRSADDCSNITFIVHDENSSLGHC